jgi:hypothetical protein
MILPELELGGTILQCSVSVKLIVIVRRTCGRRVRFAELSTGTNTFQSLASTLIGVAMLRVSV